MNRMNPKGDVLLSKAKKWRGEFERLRLIILDCQLTEELKWGWPCYTYQKRNIVVNSRPHCATHDRLDVDQLLSQTACSEVTFGSRSSDVAGG
jgi:hypothetical protein